MKKYIQLLLVAVLAVLSFGVNAQVDVPANSDDITITNSNSAWGWVGQTTARLNANTDNCYVIPFKLPTIPVGNEILEANFKFNVESYSNQLTATNIDLYGLDFRGTSTVDLINDNYAGVSDLTNATKLQEDILVGSLAEVGSNTTNVSGSSNLLSYIKTQYINGAVAGDYIFLRLSVDFLGTVETWNLTSQNGATAGNRPVLTLTYGSVTDPTFNTPIADQTVDEGSTTIINYSVTDPNGDALSVTYTNLPLFATTSFTDNGDGTGDGTVTLNPLSGDAGNYNNIRVTVDDGNGNSSDEIFNITVVNPYLFTLTTSANDGYVSDPAVVVDESSVEIISNPGHFVTVSNPEVSEFIKLGKSDNAGNPNLTSAIIPFQLPAIPAGKTQVEGAQLNIYVPYGKEYTDTSIDLYGLTYKGSDVISASDYYSGAFSSGSGVANGTDYGIEEALFSKNNPIKYLDISRFELSSANKTSLVNYINAQYTAGAVAGDWIFLRLSVNNTGMIVYQRFIVDGGDGGSLDEHYVARGDIKPAQLVLDFGAPIIARTTTWDGTSWSNGEPDNKTTTIVDSYLEVGTGKDVFNLLSDKLTITGTGELHIFNGANVFVQNNMIIDTGGKVVIESGGSFKTNSPTFSITINGDFEVIRESRATKNNFTYWSSPLSTTVQKALLDSGSPEVYKYNTSAFNDANDDGYDDDRNSWVAVTNDVIMTPGVGYAAKGSDDGTTPSVHTVTYKAGEGTGTKTINSANVVAPIFLSADASGDTDDDYDDWNLLGNPYATAISARAFINGNTNITKTLYFWTHTTDETNVGYALSDYAYYNLAGGVYPTASTGEGNSGITPTESIASGQGFMLDAITAGNVTFTPDMQVFSVNTDDNNNFYKKSTNIDDNGNFLEDRLWLRLSNGDISSQILIGFFSDASADYDNGYDAPNLDAGNDINFYSLLSEKPYSIQGFGIFSNEQKVGLGFRIDEGSSTSFTLSIDKVEGNLINQVIIITDKVTGETHNLQNDSYNFTTSKFGDINNRFEISFVSGTLSNEVSNLTSDFNIYPNPVTESFEILKTDVSKVELYNVNGNKVLSFYKQQSYNVESLTQGIYLVRVTSTNGEIMNKKIIKK